MDCPSETRLQAFVEGALGEAEVADLTVHLDACDECRALVGLSLPVPLDDGEASGKVGRYVLRRALGQGAMGVVYEAVDPDLQRVVALKVLHSREEREQERLIAEARAMALLSHPNVVTVYDVGRTEGRAFVVMELVEGVSLRAYLAQAERPLATIVARFAEAGEGLLAAHRAGLVHRDFKPENVLVAADGHAVVGDFGLAMSAATEAREVAGSRAFMAPEQRAGGVVDARADQYAFGVALREALGSRGDVPRSIARVIERATAQKPEARYPSMAELLRDLSGGQAPRGPGRLVWAVALGLAALVGVGVVAVSYGKRGPEAEACRVLGAEMDAAWSAEAAKRVHEAYVATQSPLGEPTWSRTSSVLEAYGTAWRASHGRVCERRGDAQFSGKIACLRARVEVVRAVSARLERADAAMLEQVPSMLRLLEGTEPCEDGRAIADGPPEPPRERSVAVGAARAKIAVAAATIAAGKYKDGLTMAEGATAEADATAYLPAVADAYLWLGNAHGRLGHVAEAERAFERAASSASAGRSLPTAVRAWIGLMHFVGYEGKRYDDGARYAEYARVALEGLPSAYDLELERLTWSRAMLLDRKRYDEALSISQKELALAELRFGVSHRSTAAALDGLSGVLSGQCKARSAEVPQARACAILEKEQGSPHPQLALCMGNHAALLAQRGDHEESLAMKRRVLAMFEVLPGHPNHVAMTRRNVVRSLLELGRLDEAARELEVAAQSSTPSDEVAILGLRGDLARRRGEPSSAVTEHARVVERTNGLEPSRRIEPRLSLAISELEGKRFTDAATHAELALADARAAYGDTSCRTAEPSRVLADALIDSGRGLAALVHAEHALATFDAVEPDPLATARAKLAVARALGDAERARALRLAREAREVAEKAGRDPSLVARADAWLAKNP